MAPTTAPPSADVLDESDTFFQTLIDRRRLAKAATAWSRSVHKLSSWESGHLLIENPSLENVATHKKAVERLMYFGQLLGFIVSCPEFEDVKTAEMIHATQLVIKDKFRMWHTPKVVPEKADPLSKETPKRSTSD